MSFQDQAYLHQVHSIVDKTELKAFDVYKSLLSRLRGILEATSSYEEAKVHLASRPGDAQFIKQCGSLLFDSQTTEDALARSCLIEKDVAHSLSVYRRPAILSTSGVIFDGLDLGWFSCADDRVKITFDVTPEQALEYLRKKSFWVAGIENDELLKAIQSKLEEYAQNGKTYKDFLGDVDQIFGSFGVTPPAPYRIQTVFRTNLYTAYSVAQLEQIDQMRDRFPVWRYMAIMDSATRPSHAALNGNIYREGEGPYPPLKNGDGGGLSFNCRCSAQHLHQYQVDKNVQNAIMPGEAFDLSGISEAERASFEGYLAEKQTDMAPAIKQQVQSSL